MPETPSLFRVLIYQRHWHKYVTFCGQYDRAAAKVDRTLIGSAPSRGQFHRWLSGRLRGLPYADHCRVLEQMFPEWTATELFGPCPVALLADAPPRAICFSTPNLVPERSEPARPSPTTLADVGQFADLAAVFTSRSDFTSKHPPHALFDGARHIRAAGLSLNVLCQQYPEQRLRELIEAGTTVQCLFLDPQGTAISTREQEEGHAAGTLTTLTEVNIQVLTRRVRDRLTTEARDRLRIAVYDETVRFNIVLVDARCVVQPYLPDARGVDAPTFLIHHQDQAPGLFSVFDQVFTSLWERSKPV